MATDPTTAPPQNTPEQSVEEFLAAGGQITQVPAGASGEDPKDFNWNSSHYRVRKRANLKRQKAKSSYPPND